MNITLGVPRIKEIINASKTISSPIITAPLLSEKDVKSARIVKGRIEKTLLGEIAEYIEEFFSASECYLSIKLDMNAIDNLQLSIHADTVVRSLLETKKLKLKTGVRAKGNDIVRIYPPTVSGGSERDGQSMLYSLQKIKSALPNVIVQGVSNVNRAVINDKGDGTFNLLVEGYNLRGVMTTIGVKGTETTSNHIMEVRAQKQSAAHTAPAAAPAPACSFFCSSLSLMNPLWSVLSSDHFGWSLEKEKSVSQTPTDRKKNNK